MAVMRRTPDRIWSMLSLASAWSSSSIRRKSCPNPRGFWGRQNEAHSFGGNAMQKIVPYLWFNTQAEEAARFYTSLFQDAAVLSVTPGPDGKVMSVSFQL